MNQVCVCVCVSKVSSEREKMEGTGRLHPWNGICILKLRSSVTLNCFSASAGSVAEVTVLPHVCGDLL